MSDDGAQLHVYSSFLPLCEDQDCPKATDLASTNAETGLVSFHCSVKNNEGPYSVLKAENTPLL